MKFGAKTLVNAVAVMLALPLPTAVIVVVAAIEGENVITPVGSADHVHGWLGMVVPPESFTTQLALTCRPSVCSVVKELGLSVAEPGICFTRIETDESVTPPVVALTLTTSPVWLVAAADVARPAASIPSTTL